MPRGRPTKRVKREVEDSKCFFLSIPIELRLQIYNWALVDVSDITIGVMERERNVFDDSEFPSRIADSPGQYIPILKNEYDSDLLRIAMPKVVPLPTLKDLASSMDSGYASGTSFCSSGLSSESSTQPAIATVTSQSILLTSRQIHDEFLTHVKHPTSSLSTIHVSFPHGLIVLQELYPVLLRHTSNICISGYYDGAHSKTWRPSRTAGGPGWHHQRVSGPILPTIEKKTHQAASSALARLTRTILSPDGHSTFKTMQLRIFYPDESRYGMIWGCDDSPVCLVLKNTCAGKFKTKVWRGRCGNGVTLEVEPKMDARNITMISRRWRGQPSKEATAWENFGDEASWKENGPEESCWSIS